MERGEVIRLAREAGAGVATTMSSPPRVAAAEFRGESLERFAALVAAAERARMPPAPMVVDVSAIDKGMLADLMRRERPVLVSGTPSRDEIDAAVAVEREACAKVCDEQAHNWLNFSDTAMAFDQGANSCAVAIRARK